MYGKKESSPLPKYPLLLKLRNREDFWPSFRYVYFHKAMVIIHCINFNIVNILIIIIITVSNRVGHKKAITRVTPVLA